MQLTKYTDLALRVVMHLAAFPGELGTVRDIAERYNVSRNHLMKVVHRLSGLGYIESIQGRGGGIALARAPEDIAVGAIVRDMEATLDVIDCAANNCPLIPACRLKPALDRAGQAFIDTLDGYTIADLTRNRAHIVKLVGRRHRP